MERPGRVRAGAGALTWLTWMNRKKEDQMAIDSRKTAAALRAIAKNGRLTADAVVEAARSPKHVLHAYFEWDDSVAGALYRRDQARALIVGYRVEVTSLELSAAVQWVRDPAADSHKQGYVATTVLLDDEGQARSAVIAELDRVLSCLKRASDVAQAVGVALEVGDLVKRTQALSMTLRKLRAAS